MAYTRYEEVMVGLQGYFLITSHRKQRDKAQRGSFDEQAVKFERFSHCILVIYVGACYRISILLCNFNKLRIRRASLPCRTNCMYHEALPSV